MVKCEICGKIFKAITHSHLEQKHFISLSDYIKDYPNAKIVWNKGIKMKDYNPNYVSPLKGKKYSKERLKQCKELWKTISIKERTRRAKKGIATRRSYKGKENPNFGKIGMHSWKLTKEQKAKKRGHNNPMFGHKHRPLSKFGYRFDLNQFFRSSWEANFARILVFQNKKYEYEPTAFDIGDGRTYTPDFFVKEDNCYYEIKGYYDNNSKIKLKKFKKYHKKLKLILIDEKKYIELEKEYKNKIPKWESGTKSFNKKEVIFHTEKIANITKNIIHIEKESNQYSTIFNIEVEEDNSFISDKFVTHNTAKMVAAHGKHDPKNPVKNWEAKRKRGDTTSLQQMPFLRPAAFHTANQIGNFIPRKSKVNIKIIMK